jgi:alpha-beta hydrolase superfamily lysophospholipase
MSETKPKKEKKEKKDRTKAQTVGFLTLDDNTNLFYKKYDPPATPAACIFIINSYGEHTKLYEHVARRFMREGFRVFSFDHRGYGKSEGKRGELESVEKYIWDIHQVIKVGKVNICNDGRTTMPLFLYGHSSGGVGAIIYDQMRNSFNLNQVDGVIASAPYLRMTKDIPEWQKGVINLISKVDSSYKVTTNVPVELLTSDPKFQKKYKRDKLRYSDLSAKQLKLWTDAGSFCMYDAAKFTAPLLMLHGDQDAVSDFKSSQCFIDTCGSKDKKFILAKGFLHDLHAEPDRELIFTKILQWLIFHVKKEEPKPMNGALTATQPGERRRSRVVNERPQFLNDIVSTITATSSPIPTNLVVPPTSAPETSVPEQVTTV